MSMPLYPPSRRGPRRLFLAVAAAVLVAVVAAAAAFLVTRQAPPSRSAPGPSPSRRPPTNSDGRVPSRTAGPAAVSTSGWQSYTLDGAVLPASPADGPSSTAGGLASGFSDTPAGAVLAAVNIAVRVSGQLGPDVFTPTIAKQVTGAGEQALLAAAWQEYSQAIASAPPSSGGGPAGTVTATVTSFKVSAWTSSVAVISLTSAGSTSAAVFALQLEWLGGDWRLVAPASGSFPGSAAASRVPSGYTQLPGA